VSAPTPGAPSPQRSPARSWTVLELLRWTQGHFAGRGIETARLDAECLLAHALGVERLRLYVDFDKPVGEAERAAFRELVRRRAGERIPVAHLVGLREFWSLPLRVTPDVLVPRPETETLVTAGLDLVAGAASPRVLDLGTGSGAVALALARELPGARVTATDTSAAALKLAQENAERLDLAERIRFLEGDWLEPVVTERFDLVVSNPPYVAEAERPRLAPELAHEPPGALFAGPDGLAALRRLTAGVGSVLEPRGAVAFELDPRQAAAVAGWLRDAGFAEVAVHRDLAGRPRVVSGRRGEPQASEDRADRQG
jgi:release factor glutamine methyltransferase